jgi:hypothetical protein
MFLLRDINPLSLAEIAKPNLSQKRDIIKCAKAFFDLVSQNVKNENLIKSLNLKVYKTMYNWFESMGK